MTHLASKSLATPHSLDHAQTMTPSQQQRKDSQDEARRQQQADERVRELEEENKQFRAALSLLRKRIESMNQHEDLLHGGFSESEKEFLKGLESANRHFTSAFDGGGNDA